ncbi:ABC transporter permease [Eubacteriales bacterium OttesenSCG-928-N13]|nr:ABC transporter permease [Eubacteriales bacterium OttesenSCG-928-N13]
MKRSWFAMPYIAWMAMFTIAPLLLVVFFAFTNADGQFTLINLRNFFDPTYLSILWRSLYLAFFCTIICLLIGYPAAFFLASKDFAKNQALFVLILLPMWMNFLLRTYAMMSLLEDRGIINNMLVSLGFERLELIGNEGAVLLGMVYNFVPFMILPIYTALKKMDTRVIEAAEDLGANPFNVFRRVVFPLSIPGIVSGITMVFMPAVTTFAISRLLGSGNFWLFGDIIERKFLESNDWNFGSALSLIMMLLIIASIGLLNKADAKQEGGGAW